jgi:hypothetical protein
MPPSQIRGEAEQKGGDQRNEAEDDQPIGGRPPMQLGNRARRDDQHQEGEDPGFDGQGPKGHLLVAEHPRDAHHPAVENGEGEQRRADVEGSLFRRIERGLGDCCGLGFGRHAATRNAMIGRVN